MSLGRGSIPPQGGHWDSSMSRKLKGKMLKAACAAPLSHSLQERQNFPFANLCLYFSGFPTAAHSRYITPCSWQSHSQPRWGASPPNRCHNPPHLQEKVCTSSRTPALILTIATQLCFLLATQTVSNREESSFYSVAGDAGEAKPSKTDLRWAPEKMLGTPQPPASSCLLCPNPG